MNGFASLPTKVERPPQRLDTTYFYVDPASTAGCAAISGTIVGGLP
ncbi:hypothetical protein OCAR_4893 [Afipia carboxidovorans OM5]|nr:hypothetical protein OCAR_4893 [Afipia carboxidovorans OM5]